METVTLKGEDFRVLHNTLWELGRIDHPQVQQLVERIRSVALKDAYAQDNDVFESKMAYYREFQRDNGLSSIWSIYELPVHGFLESHPYPLDAVVVYKGQHCAVWGPTWADVYRSAEQCILRSGDDHHIFIEGFEQVGNELRLTTGS